MSIKKIISVKNAGRFKNHNAAGDVEFKKFTLIFGENGRGKTTLCAILRSLQDGSPDHIIGRKTIGVAGVPSIHIQLETGPVYFRDLNWTQTVPDLLIFDQDFITNNVYFGNSVGAIQRRNLYKIIIGGEGVRLARDHEAKKQEISEVQSRIRDLGRTISSHLTPDFTVDSFLGAPRNENVDSLIESTQRELTAASEADLIRNHKILAEVTIFAIPNDIQTLLNSTIDSVSADVESRINQHIATHLMGRDGQSWITKGLQFKHDSDCPFCGQDVSNSSTITLYNQYFSDAYKQLKENIIQRGVEFSQSFGDGQIQQVLSAIRENETTLQFWKRYLQLGDLRPIDLTVVESTLSETREAVLQILRIKAASPLERLEVDERTNVAIQRFGELSEQLTRYNSDCGELNVVINAKKNDVQNINISALQATLRRLQLIKQRYEEPLATHCSNLIELNRQKGQWDAEKDQLKLQLDTYSATTFGRYQTSINGYLEKFNAGFTIANVDPNFVGGANAKYQIVINNTPITLGDLDTPESEPSFKNTLSSGDRSTLALAFFLAQVDHHQRKNDLILLFDDPFSSQDSFRRNQTAIEIFRIGNQCKQTIVLSHDAHFLKLVQDKVHGAAIKTLQFIPSGVDNTELRELDLDKLLMPELRAIIDKLQLYRSNNAGDPNDIVQKLRPLLEGHCRNMCMTLFADNAMLSEILNHIRENPTDHPLGHIYNELNDINDYSTRHHHADGSVTHILNQGELMGYVIRTLRLVGAR